MHLHRRALSSPRALRLSIENRIKRLECDISPEDPIEADQLQALVVDRAVDPENQDGQAVIRADKAHLGFDLPAEVEAREWRKILEELKKIDPTKDAKLQTLCTQVIPELFEIAEKNPGTPARVIVFTSYKDTLDYYEEHVQKALGCPVVTLDGSLSEKERYRRFALFAEQPQAVLIATDVISEGVNLQSASCMVVHESVPYNPNRLDQREGRVDRFGQKNRFVYVRTLFCLDTSDEDVMELLVRKLAQMRRDQGFSPPFFATEETVRRVLSNKRKKRDKAQVVQYTLEDQWFRADEIELIRSEGFYGQADVRVAEVSDKLKQLYERVGTPDEVQCYIIDGLRYFNCQVNKNVDGTLEIILNNPRLLVPGLEMKLDRVVFNSQDKERHPAARYIDVGHPLVRRLNALIRQESLSGEQRPRTAAYQSAEVPRTTLIAHGVLRVVAKTSPPILIEELVVYGVEAGTQEGPLSPEEAIKRAKAAPLPADVDRAWAIQRLRDLADTKDLQRAKEKAIADTMAALARFRTKAKSEIDSDQETDWMKGYDQVEQIGFDVQTYTLILPRVK